MSRSFSKRPTSPRRSKRKILHSFLIAGGILGAVVIALAVLLGIAVYTTKSTLPDFDKLKASPNGQTIRVHANDGTVIVNMGPGYGRWIPYNEIPKSMTEAMIATEDRRFRYHLGVDPIGMLRAVGIAVLHHGQGRRWQGASTITQQLARNVFLTNNYSFARKIREAMLALALEQKFTKNQILELYLNRVYFGGGAYGIDAASRKFYNHPATQLSLPEAAIIAGLVKAPSNYSPTADPEAAIGRGRVVLGLMAEQHLISPTEQINADPENVGLSSEPHQNGVRYFTDWALAQLDSLIETSTEPIDVWTTLDLTMQRAADTTIQNATPKGAQGALVTLDTDGAVRAMVGGRDYVSSIYNRATQATRQPGSAFKLFVYLAALENGVKPDDRIVDEPVTINGWSPRNASRHFSGDINIRTAFAFSLNTIAAKLGNQVGFNTVAAMAQRLGITTPIDVVPSMVLGTSDVRLIDMTRAFAVVARKGIAVTPYGISRVTTSYGKLLYQHSTDEDRVLLAPWVAAEMTDLLQTAVATGTARAAQIGRPVAGKTGTTSSNHDGWFIGFSSGLTTGIWMGRDDSKTVPGLSGGHAPAAAFSQYMRVAVADRPVMPFETQVTLPDTQVEPDDEAYFGDAASSQSVNGTATDSVSSPAPSDGHAEATPPPSSQIKPAEKMPTRLDSGKEKPASNDQALDKKWLDNVLGQNE
ncbi:transglycosylase domain-containing protein [Zymomonas mobilis]|uniref:Penicillin-binding protein, 1A family n=1 Tax=Zymomonas mobilis subsp. pomaceae (strain ATCC 29192 / DSM 22645 / JCM 10191 / CCUG 17912 / NBRC 13757 / NCIMB 11200 / NRRL B-4491 / Barker I) TaxID=579138 RepID=F8ES45_ZYMMT|nr:PBP1A family penicillin-binding protein [Zymomonas mobilis]AEI37620.1 penicillin-binding protein, 1A family [Zymomonas mobilis subsp. pomaceae ATCC 29192]MDX5948988.1 PBP1A family penicillin-binding protein [Zymomonas mobilis subsp. pomaceae]